MDREQPVNVLGVTTAWFPTLFPAIKHYFESFAARSHGETTVDDLYHEVMAQDRQCWIAWNGEIVACALTLVDTGHMLVVELTHCSGKGREEWQSAVVDEVEQWARHIGAKRMRTINRPGWAKFLRSKGLRETHRVMEKDLG